MDTVRAKYFPNTGNPNAGTYKYKLQIRDSCGGLSQLSQDHNTIFIINNSGTFSWPQLYLVGGTNNPVNNYVLMRDNNSNGNWMIVNSVTGSQQTVTDPQYATYQATASWRVETQWSISCSPTRINPEVLGFNSSRSNIFSFANGVNEYYNNSSVSIYPNPFSETTTLRITNRGRITNYNLAVTDIYGKVVYSDAIRNSNEFEIHRNNLPAGMYFYKVTGGDTIIATGKLVIE